MQLCTLLFATLVACAVAYPQFAPAPAVRPEPERRLMVVEQPNAPRQKRSLLLGALGVGAIGAGLFGAGLVGAGAVGAGVIGAKAGLIGGALASRAFSGRSYGGGYGYGGGYSYGGGYGYGGDYYYEPTPVVYGGYRSYPAYYVDEDWC